MRAPTPLERQILEAWAQAFDARYSARAAATIAKLTSLKPEASGLELGLWTTRLFLPARFTAPFYDSASRSDCVGAFATTHAHGAIWAVDGRLTHIVLSQVLDSADAFESVGAEIVREAAALAPALPADFIAYANTHHQAGAFEVRIFAADAIHHAVLDSGACAILAHVGEIGVIGAKLFAETPALVFLPYHGEEIALGDSLSVALAYLDQVLLAAKKSAT